MLIGITGKAGSGKSEIANQLVRRHKFHKTAFAEKLKEVAQYIYKLSHEQLYGNLKDVVDQRLGITPRFILQMLGTEVARHIYKDTWIMLLADKVNGYPNTHWVIDDVRFLNEAEWIKSKGGILFHVYGRDQVVDINEAHQSESEIDQLIADVNISNTAGLEELYEMIDVFIKEQVK